MEFWGVEVTPGKTVKVIAEEDTIVHISQYALGDCKGRKGDYVNVFVQVEGKKLVLGSLQSENISQFSCDLMFDKDFELSHNWTKGSVFLTGYKSPNICNDEDEEDLSDLDEVEEDVQEVPATVTATGNAVVEPKAKPAEVKKPESADAEEEDDSDSEDGMDEDDSEDDDDSEEEEETPTPKKPVSSKKRANEDAPETPVSAKKAKSAVTPQKTGHTATPHPAKKGAQSPKSSASYVSCGSCAKTFNTGKALESHTKAKHSAAK